MRQTELKLTKEDRERIGEICAKGVRQVREINRAHVLAALDRKVPETCIMQVLGIRRKMIWRTRVAYLDGGLELALKDLARPGKPKVYATKVEAEVNALACSAPPEGAKRWTLQLLEAASRKRSQTKAISRETIRRLLKKLPQTLAPHDVVRRQTEPGIPAAHVRPAGVVRAAPAKGRSAGVC